MQQFSESTVQLLFFHHDFTFTTATPSRFPQMLTGHLPFLQDDDEYTMNLSL